MKRKIKYALSSLMAAVMLFVCFAVFPSAKSAGIEVSTDKKSYFEGEFISAQVYFPDKFNIAASLDLTLHYDSQKLEVVSVKQGTDLRIARNEQKNGEFFSENHKIPGCIKWSLAAAKNYNFKGVFAEIVFKVLPMLPINDKESCTLSLEVTDAANSGYVDVKPLISVGSADFEIERIILKPIKKIEIYTKPKTKYYYKRDEFNPEGLSLKVTYTDGSSEIISDTAKMEFSGFSNSSVGKKTVHVKFRDAQTSFKVTVTYKWWEWIIVILLFGWLWY